jgi:hypothetical protein
MATTKQPKPKTASRPKYPASLGACIDLLYERRRERLDEQKKIDALKLSEDDLESYIINTFSKQDLDGGKGRVAVAAIKRLTTVNTTDWDGFIAYVAKKKAWDLLRRQPSVSAVKERWEAGVEVPGVEPFHKISLSLTKV